MDNTETVMNRKEILSSAQRAIRGLVTPNIQAITIRYSSSPVILKVYFDEEPSQTECSLIKDISSKISTDFKEITEIRDEFQVNETLVCLDDWIYLQITDN
jgi:hypothetical protein